MTLSHFDLESPLDFSESAVNVLVVEDESRYLSFCKELYNQVNGAEGGFSFFDNEKEVAFSKYVTFVQDVFNLSLNDKKFSLKLYQQLQNIMDREYLADYTAIQIKICALLDSLNVESDYPIEYDEDCGFVAILKAYGVRFESDEGSLVQILCSFIHIGAAFLKTRLFVFVNLKTFLSPNDLKRIYKEAALEDVGLLLLENTVKTKLEGEKIRIIDRDLCEIIV